jgi:hypothetical protein
MTPDQLKALYPDASPSFILLNSTHGNPFSPAIAFTKQAATSLGLTKTAPPPSKGNG